MQLPRVKSIISGHHAQKRAAVRHKRSRVGTKKHQLAEWKIASIMIFALAADRSRWAYKVKIAEFLIACTERDSKQSHSKLFSCFSRELRRVRARLRPSEYSFDGVFRGMTKASVALATRVPQRLPGEVILFHTIPSSIGKLSVDLPFMSHPSRPTLANIYVD